MEPASLLAVVGGAFLGKLEHLTLFATAIIILIWWVYRDKVWSVIKP